MVYCKEYEYLVIDYKKIAIYDYRRVVVGGIEINVKLMLTTRSSFRQQLRIQYLTFWACTETIPV